jgi:hypothetical protein
MHYTDFDRVYEPAEDSFLFMDALSEVRRAEATDPGTCGPPLLYTQPALFQLLRVIRDSCTPPSHF